MRINIGGIIAQVHKNKAHAQIRQSSIMAEKEKEGLIKQSPQPTYQGAAVIFQPQVGRSFGH